MQDLVKQHTNHWAFFFVKCNLYQHKSLDPDKDSTTIDPVCHANMHQEPNETEK